MFSREMRDLAHVHRWGILRRSRNQSVAEHSFFTAIYAIEIAAWINWPGDRSALIWSALVHDLPEIWYGDIPGPAKRAIIDERKTRDLEYAQMHMIFPLHRPYCRPEGDVKLILDVADRLDALFFLADEHNMGNISVGDVNDPKSPFGASWTRLRKALLALPCQAELLHALIDIIWNETQRSASGISNIYVD